jgi:hypothetical protein
LFILRRVLSATFKVEKVLLKNPAVLSQQGRLWQSADRRNLLTRVEARISLLSFDGAKVWRFFQV